MNGWKININRLAWFESNDMIKLYTKGEGYLIKLSFLTECDDDGHCHDDNWHRRVEVYDTYDAQLYDLRKVRGKAEYILQLRSESNK